MKKNISIIIAVVGLATLLLVVTKNRPVTLSSSGLLPVFSIDDMIKMSELIVIGEVKTTLPSRWMGPNGNDLKNASPEEVTDARGLFTDSLILIDQNLKGNIVEPIVRVRSFIGETEKVRWVNDAEPSFIIKRTYLFFLVKDFGPTAKVDQGDYIPVGAYQGVYEIIDGKAISAENEWVLEELIAYIQKSLAQPVSTEPAVIEIPTETPIFAESTETEIPTETLTSTETVISTP